MLSPSFFFGNYVREILSSLTESQGEYHGKKLLGYLMVLKVVSGLHQDIFLWQRILCDRKCSYQIGAWDLDLGLWSVFSCNPTSGNMENSIWRFGELVPEPESGRAAVLSGSMHGLTHYPDSTTSREGGADDLLKRAKQCSPTLGLSVREIYFSSRKTGLT